MSETFVERRSQVRHKVLKGGTLAFDGGGSVDCTVRNISQIGARVDIASPIGVPASFTLYIASEHFMRHCHRVWSSERRIGVVFD